MYDIKKLRYIFMLKVVGVQSSVGEYNGSSYSNYNIYVVDTVKQQHTLVGICPFKIKVKQSFFKDNFDVKSLYQKNIEVFYNAYQQVCKIEVIDK